MFGRSTGFDISQIWQVIFKIGRYAVSKEIKKLFTNGFVCTRFQTDFYLIIGM